MKKLRTILASVLLSCIAAVLFGLGMFFPNELRAYTNFRSPLVVRESVTHFGTVVAGERAFRQISVFNNRLGAVRIQEMGLWAFVWAGPFQATQTSFINIY